MENTAHPDKFPDGFLWGTATSAYQTEGHNTNTDWWVWEQENIRQIPSTRAEYLCIKEQNPNCKFPQERAGIACDSYNRYEEDLDLCVKLNNNAVRLSVEWARIEPRKGEFDHKEIDHYKKVLQAAKDRNLKTFVTLHHFTHPLWFSKKGSWLDIDSPRYFAKYAKKCAEEFGSLVDSFLTINEPQVLTMNSYVQGLWPPNKRNLIYALIVQINLIRAHRHAYKVIKAVVPHKPVGIVKNIINFEAHPEGNTLDKILAWGMYFMNEQFFLLPLIGTMDLIGLNHYFTTWLKNRKMAQKDDFNSDLNWWIYPPGLKKILVKLKKYNIPIYVTENGLADAMDEKRPRFLQGMLTECLNAIKEGVPLKGYFYWALIDNYEWHQGYWPKFGLVEVNRFNGLERIPRPSFDYYSQIAKNNSLISNPGDTI